jgi:hypothetical protein
MEAECMDGACDPFLEFLQIASTQSSETHPVTHHDPLGLKGYAAQPKVLKLHRSAVLYILLPDLQPMGEVFPDAFTLAMSAGLTIITTEMHADRRAQDTHAAEARRKKTFRDKYGNWIVDGTLLLARVSDDDFIPAYYQGFGGGGSPEGGVRTSVATM